MRIACAAALAGALLALSADAQRPSTPATGRDALQAMHDAYAGKWYTTLTFVQKTTRRTDDGRDTVATWYESLRYTPEKGAQLRIDIGSPKAGNGVLYTADSLWAFKDGKLAVTRAGGNSLIPLIASVYLQPVDRTIAELAATGVDFTRPVIAARWKDRDVWIIGALSAADTASPQIWVNAGDKQTVRAMFKPVPTRPVMDARLEGIVPLAGGMLATHCEFYVEGKLVQSEDYTEWKANAPLSSALFDPATFSTAKHWAP